MNKLPEKWCVEVTEESSEVLGEWRDNGSVSHKKSGYCYYPYYVGTHIGYYSQDLDPKVTLISFDTFKRLVLNEKPTFFNKPIFNLNNLTILLQKLNIK